MRPLIPILLSLVVLLSASIILTQGSVAAETDDEGTSDDPTYGALNYGIDLNGPVGQEITRSVDLGYAVGSSYLLNTVRDTLPDGLSVSVDSNSAVLTISGVPTEPCNERYNNLNIGTFLGQPIFLTIIYDIYANEVNLHPNATDAICDVESVGVHREPLPEPVRPGYHFMGWYTEPEGGSLAGNVGDVITDQYLTANLYAHWEPNGTLNAPAWTVYGNQQITFTYTPTFTNRWNEQVTDFAISVNDDPTDCMDASGTSISGDFHGLLPGNYAVTFTVTADGYDDTTWTVYVNQSILIIDDPEGTFTVGETYSDSLAIKPNDATITGYSATLDGEFASTSIYQLNPSGRMFTFTPEKAGLWAITLELSAPGYSSTNYTFSLIYVEPSTDPDPEPGNPPTIGGIHYVKVSNDGIDNTYMFSARNAYNYDRMTWDFDDCTVPSFGDNQTHSFPGPGVYTVTCTVTKGNQFATAEVTITAGDLTTDQEFADQTNINSRYHQSFFIGVADPIVTVTGTSVTGGDLADSRLSWLVWDVIDLEDGRYIFDISGTCQDPTLAGATIHIRVEEGTGGELWEWDVSVLAEVTTSIPNQGEVHADYVADGLEITLTDLNPRTNSITLVVDWDDGTMPVKNGSASTFTHTYEDPGSYNVQLTWKFSVAGSETRIPLILHVTVSDDRDFELSYEGGDNATGSMDSQTGSAEYEVAECGFEYEGHEFLGWNTESDFTGDTYSPGDTIELTEDTTLYAMWSGEGGASANGGDDDTLGIAAGITVIIAIVIIAAFVVTRYL